MPDLFDLISRRWKLIAGIIVLSLVVAAAITLVKPKEYLSITTALPANPAISDKGAIFNENIEGLYSALGSPDELDRIVGTAELDTVYLYVTDQLNLAKGNRMRAAALIKQNSRVYKSGHGDLRVKAWHKDAQMAAEIANAIMQKLSAIYGELLGRNNQQTLQQLIKARSSLNPDEQTTAVYDKLIAEYQLMELNKMPPLLIVEKARASIKPDKPRMFRTLVLAAFAGLIFAILLAIILEKRNSLTRDSHTAI
jgi:uncharacterized protein involved in exopolysaccharide biosynthesis